VASAAVEAPEGGRAPSWRAAALKRRQMATSVGVRGHGWHAPFAASPPFSAHDLVRKPDTTFRDHALAGGESFRGVVVKQNSGAKTRRENDFVYPRLLDR